MSLTNVAKLQAPGVRRACALLHQLGPEAAARVFRELTTAEASLLAAALEQLPPEALGAAAHGSRLSRWRRWWLGRLQFPWQRKPAPPLGAAERPAVRASAFEPAARFAGIAHWPARAQRELLRRADPGDLRNALHSADDLVRAALLRQMPWGERRQWRARLNEVDLIPLDEIEAAQRRLLRLV